MCHITDSAVFFRQALYSGKNYFCHKAASRRQYIEYGTDSVAALAAYKIVLFELRRSNAVAEIKFFRYNRINAIFCRFAVKWHIIV